MTDERRAIVQPGGRATCYSCGALLALRGAWVRLGPGLVPRPNKEPRTGLPRFGPVRRKGHKPREAADFLADASTRAIGSPGAIYVNCPACDRGQVVQWA